MEIYGNIISVCVVVLLHSLHRHLLDSWHAGGVVLFRGFLNLSWDLFMIWLEKYYNRDWRGRVLPETGECHCQGHWFRGWVIKCSQSRKENTTKAYNNEINAKCMGRNYWISQKRGLCALVSRRKCPPQDKVVVPKWGERSRDWVSRVWVSNEARAFDNINWKEGNRRFLHVFMY